MLSDHNAPNVISVISQQHVTIRQLFDDVRRAAPAQRSSSFEALVRLLAMHETAEEEVVYPTIKRQGDHGTAVAEARKLEEDAAKKALADLEKTDPSSAAFVAGVERLRADVEAHAAREEAEVLPLLASLQDSQQDTVSRAFAAAESVAPTRAHRTAPESAVGNVLLGPFVAIVDRVRDAIRRARRPSPRRDTR